MSNDNNEKITPVNVLAKPISSASNAPASKPATSNAPASKPADANHDALVIANAGIKATQEKAASAALKPANKQVKKSKKAAKRHPDGLNKKTAAFRSDFKTKSVDQAIVRDEIHETRLTNDPKIKDNSVRSSLLGVAGMVADTHGRSNAYLSGMSAKELRVFQDFKIPASLMSRIPDEGGFSREHKFYVFTVCCCISSGRRPRSLDLVHLSDAAKAIDPKWSAKKVGHNTINLLINFLKTGEAGFTLQFWTDNKDRCNGDTQGRYLLRFFKICNMGVVTGTKGATNVVIDYDHPIIKALKAIA